VNDEPPHIEVYDGTGGRYLTVTGHCVEELPNEIEKRPQETKEVWRQFIADADGDTDDEQPPVSERPEPAGEAGDLDDSELIEKAKAADNGDKFRRLWNGNTSGYESHSEADLALCGMLAFWTGSDRRQIDRLFRQSGLCRDKWTEREDYRQRTIDEALSGQTDHYQPDGGSRYVDTDADARAVAARDDAPRDPSLDDGDELPDPNSVAAVAGHDGMKALKGLSHAERAYYAWKALRPHLDLLVSLPDETLFTYDGGVWDDEGNQTLREAGSQALGPYYARNVRDELKEQVATTDGYRREKLGVEPGTVAVENGLLDLDSRDLRPLTPEDYALRQLPVAYDPDADAPRWEQFIEESVESDRQKALQEYVGYCLHVGEMPIHRALLLVGTGSNGKSTFLNIVTDLLGSDNTTGYSLEDLVDSEYHVAQMHGTVANIDPDVGDWISNPSMFKKLVGGDRKVSARHPYCKPFDFNPTAKQLYAANEVPGTKVDDDAFFRRWLIVEFPHTFTAPDEPGPDKDPELVDTLRSELSGILNWALEGYDRLMKQGHFTNEGDASDKWDRWQSWGDSIDRFLSECINTDGDAKQRSGDVYARYKAWCEQHGISPDERSPLTKRIKKLNGVRYSSSFRFAGKQDRGFKGFTFTADAPPATESGTTDTAGDQSTLGVPQREAIATLRETVAELTEDNDGDAVPVDTVVDAVQGELGGRDPEHLIDNLLESGELYTPQDGRVLPT
jgi:putative DNA primase/helicase